jgi:biotin transport system substrate-specific component
MQLIKNISSNQLIKKIFLVFIGSILLAISSKIKIPFYPVPMTMQTFVVVLIGMLYGWKLGVFTVALYLFEGAIGLPVFAGTPEKGIGLIYFTGPTMGYLMGFLLAVFISGYFYPKIKTSEQNEENLFGKLIISVKFFMLFVASMLSIYILGIIWLSNFVGWEKVLVLGVYPFVLAEMFKISILTVLAKLVKI